VGYDKMVVEKKLINECEKRGRMEDVVVRDEYSGKKIGKLIIMNEKIIQKKIKS
jgi:glucosamine-phosphate N-acetyltransferase